MMLKLDSKRGMDVDKIAGNNETLTDMLEQKKVGYYASVRYNASRGK